MPGPDYAAGGAIWDAVPGFLARRRSDGEVGLWDDVAGSWSLVSAMGGGGASCLDGIVVYDNPGGTIPTGVQIPMSSTMLNTDGTNYALGSVVPGAVTILNDGAYLVRAQLAITDPGAVAVAGAWQAVIQTTTSGLGAWANLVGADGYAAAQRNVLLLGGVATGQASGFVLVSGGGGLDVQLVGNTMAASSGTETTFAQASRLEIVRLC